VINPYSVFKILIFKYSSIVCCSQSLSCVKESGQIFNQQTATGLVGLGVQLQNGVIFSFQRPFILVLNLHALILNSALILRSSYPFEII